jgi:putative peptidoglycan lipid II flippase
VRNEALKKRIDAGLSRLVFFVIPSSAAFLFIGEQLSQLLFEGGQFGAADSRYVWYLLIGSGVGLVAQTSGRLYSSSFYALKDTRTPLKFAVVRVVLASGLGFVAIRWVPGWLNIPNDLGAAFLVAAAGLAAWIEFTLLQRGIRKRIGPVGLPAARVAKLWACAVLAGLAALGAKWGLVQVFGPNLAAAREFHGDLLPPPAFSPTLTGLICVAVFGAVYLVVTSVAGVGDARGLLNRVIRRR